MIDYSLKQHHYEKPVSYLYDVPFSAFNVCQRPVRVRDRGQIVNACSGRSRGCNARFKSNGRTTDRNPDPCLRKNLPPPRVKARRLHHPFAGGKEQGQSSQVRRALTLPFNLFCTCGRATSSGRREVKKTSVSRQFRKS